MILKGIIFAIFNVLVISSHWVRLRKRDVYLLEKRIRETHPHLYEKHDTNREYNSSTFLSAFSTLGLSTDTSLVINEINESIFEKGNYWCESLWLLGEVEEGAVREVVRNLVLCEAVSLLQLRRGRNYTIDFDVVDADNEFEIILSRSSEFLEGPILKKVKGFIDQGLPLDILKKLLTSKMALFLENAHLNLWRGSFGDLLIEYVIEGHVENYDFYTLNYLEENVVAQDWIMLAKREGFPTETIVLMLDFPERAEYIYKTPESKALEGIFISKISDWRQSFAQKINWSQVKWRNAAKFGVSMEQSLLPLKEDLYFGSLVAWLGRYDPCAFHLSTECECSFHKLVTDFLYNMIANDRQELIYSRLRNEGYSIQNVFVAPNDELESRIWEDFKLRAEGMGAGWDWIQLKLLEIIGKELSLSYSRIALGGQFLLHKHLEECSTDEMSNVLSSLHVRLNDYFGGGINIHLKENCNCHDFCCINTRLSSKVGRKDDNLRKILICKIGSAQLYPRVMAKLKQDCDRISRGFLLDILERITSKKLGSVYSAVIGALKSDFDGFCRLCNDNENSLFQEWSDNIEDLAKNVRRVYLLCHPRDIFTYSTLDQAIARDKDILSNDDSKCIYSSSESSTSNCSEKTSASVETNTAETSYSDADTVPLINDPTLSANTPVSSIDSVSSASSVSSVSPEAPIDITPPPSNSTSSTSSTSPCNCIIC